MKAVVAAFNQEKVLVGAFSVITNLRMELFEALLYTVSTYPGTAGTPSGSCPTSTTASSSARWDSETDGG